MSSPVFVGAILSRVPSLGHANSQVRRYLAGMVDIQGTCDDRFAAVRTAFERNFNELGDVGAAVSVRLDGEAVVDLWGGLADPAADRPWLRDTPALVFSTTKGLTAVCALRLWEQGEL